MHLRRLALALLVSLPTFCHPVRAQESRSLSTLFLVGRLPLAEVRFAFDLARIQLAESSSGQSTPRGYIHSGAWDKVLAEVHPGDFVVLYLPPVISPPQTDGWTLAGFGDETADSLDPQTGKRELIHSYGWYLRRMVVDVISHGGVPLLCAPPLEPSGPAFADWVRHIAVEQRVPLIQRTSSASGAGSETAFRSDLRNTTPNPLAPFLKAP